ncbi:MAG: cytochrome c4 [Proteobacteria bacterium]|nr:cytochrome c4 [Pseudomonadota bacterium]
MKKTSWIVGLALAGTLGAATAADIKGDAQAGAQKNAMCIGCHGIPGYHASFPRVYKVPMISGQKADYIAAALTAYRKGDRRHPSMRGIAGSLSDQDIADLAAYYSQHGHSDTAAAPPDAALPSALQDKLAICVTCHGANFSTPTTPGAPRLAGQHADYLAVAMRNYQAPGAMVGNNNAIMAPMVKDLQPADIRAIADYLGGLPGELHTIPESRLRR